MSGYAKGVMRQWPNGAIMSIIRVLMGGSGSPYDGTTRTDDNSIGCASRDRVRCDPERNLGMAYWAGLIPKRISGSKRGGIDEKAIHDAEAATTHSAQR